MKKPIHLCYRFHVLQNRRIKKEAEIKHLSSTMAGKHHRVQEEIIKKVSARVLEIREIQHESQKIDYLIWYEMQRQIEKLIDGKG